MVRRFFRYIVFFLEGGKLTFTFCFVFSGFSLKQRKFWLVGGFSDCDFDEVQVG